ncbi:MAG TPA: hypothetical protein VIN08_03370 [Ohtaekwangia sp.]|uniref:hypothetical protein n=1 Tax=Ohtaekwangia sp. TaxID=2066019 RepID=UPI002F935FC8
MKKFVNGKVVLRYLYDQLTGNFAGFLIGMSASSLVSKFFETRSIKNLWGLTAKKTVVDKATFSNLEWILSIVIGFIVFEIFTKVIKEKIDKNFPRYKIRVMRWMIVNHIPEKASAIGLKLNQQRIALFAAVHQAVVKTKK